MTGGALNMLPNLAQADAANAVVSRFEHYGKFSGCSTFDSKASYFKNLFLGKSGFRVLFSFGAFVSAARHFVSVILSYSPHVKMFWIAARRIITSMANKHTFWNFSKSLFPSEAVSSFRSIADFNSAVALGVNPSRPFPTRKFSVGFIHRVPESFRLIRSLIERACFSQSAVVHIAKSSLFGFFLAIIYAAFVHGDNRSTCIGGNQLVMEV